MTNEEAIIKLRSILTEAKAFEDSVCYVTEDDAEALKMAIAMLERYERFKKRAEVVISMLRADRNRLEEAIEKIRAEIEQTAKDHDKFDDYRRVRGLWIALEIIDKYTAESEDD